MTSAALLFLHRVVKSQLQRGLPREQWIFDEGTGNALHRELSNLHLIEKLFGTPYGGFGWRVTEAGIALVTEGEGEQDAVLEEKAS